MPGPGPEGAIEVIWTPEWGEGAMVKSSPAVVDNVVNVGVAIAYRGGATGTPASHGGLVGAIASVNYMEFRCFEAGAPANSSPAVIDGVIHVGSNVGNL